MLLKTTVSFKQQCCTFLLDHLQAQMVFVRILLRACRLTDWVKEVWFSFHHTSFNCAELTVDFIVSKN